MNGPDAPSAPGPRPAAPPSGRRRWLRRLAAGVLGATLVLGAAGAWLAVTESGLRALAGAAQRLSAGRLQIDGLRGRLSGPLELERLRYADPATGSELRIEGLGLAWQPGGLLQRRLDIDRLAVAEFDLQVPASPADAAPLAPPDTLGLPFAVAARSLAVGTFALRRSGEPEPFFRFNDLNARLTSDGARHRLEQLALKLPYGDLQLSGSVDGRAPFALDARGELAGRQGGHDFVARAELSGDLLAPRLRGAVEGAGLRGQAEAEASPFAEPALRRLKLAVNGFDPAAFVADAPAATLDLDAELDGRMVAGAFGLGGPVRIVNRAPVTLDRGGIPLAAVAGTLAWAGGAVEVVGLQLDLAGGGTVTGDFSWVADGAWGRLGAALELAGIDLARIDGRLPRQTLAGNLSAAAEARHRQAELALRIGPARVEARAEQTDDGAGNARYTLDARVRDLDPRALHPTAPRARLDLALEASGESGARRRAALRFRLPGGRYEGRPVTGAGRFEVEASAAGWRVSDADVALNVAGNRVSARGAWGEPADRLAVAVDAPALAALGYGLGGRAGLEGEIGGGRSDPGGRATLFAERLSLPGGLRIAGVNAAASMEPRSGGRLALAAGVSGIGDGGGQRIEALQLAIDGRRDAHRIDLRATGVAEHEVELALAGALVPATGPLGWQWRGQVEKLLSAGALALRLRDPVGLRAAVDGVELGAAVIDAGDSGRIRLDETRWSPAASVLRGSLTGLAFGLVSRPDGRPRRGPGPLQLGAEWDLRLAETAEGELRVFREAGDLTVSGEIATRLGLDTLEARLVARANRLAGSLAARGSELGELSGTASAALERTAEGGWRLAGAQPLLASVRLHMPSIAWLGRLMRENVETSGQVDAEFTLAGTPDAPRASGRIRGAALGLALADQGLLLTGGELLADFDRDRLRLERLAFVSPNRVRPREGRIALAALTATPGTLSASGVLALDTGEGDFSFAADRLPLLQREDRWLLLSGEGSVRSTWETVAVDAALRADAGYFAIAETPPPSLSDDVVVLGRETAPAQGGMALRADLRVGLGEALYLSAFGVETRLAGNIELRQRPGLPLAATGTIATVGGSYKGYGQRLAIERGLVSFQGVLDDPGLNIVALRKGLAVEAGVAITGSARHPRVRLVSEPSVPDPEKLSWIVLGRAPDAGAGGDLALLLPAAQALLGGPGGGMTEQLSRSLGFDAFSIGQGDLNSASRSATSRVAGSGTMVAGSGTVAGQVLSLGKRLSSDLFLSFEQSLGGAESLVKLTYQLGRRVSLVARGGTDNALDLYYTFAFR